MQAKGQDSGRGGEAESVRVLAPAQGVHKGRGHHPAQQAQGEQTQQAQVGRGLDDDGVGAGPLIPGALGDEASVGQAKPICADAADGMGGEQGQARLPVVLA